jgi:hypothetical protein
VIACSKNRGLTSEDECKGCLEAKLAGRGNREVQGGLDKRYRPMKECENSLKSMRMERD